MATPSAVHTFTLDMRHVFTPFERADMNSITQQLEVVCSGVDEWSVWMLPGWSNLENSLTVCTDREDVAEKLENALVQVNHPVLGLQPFSVERKLEREPIEVEELADIRVTFTQCRLGELLHVPNSMFDNAMKRLWGVTLLEGTQHENRYPDNLPTGNRFCVIQGIELDKLNRKLEKLKVRSPHSPKTYEVNAQFSGKQRICRVCKEAHSGRCGRADRFFQLKKRKQHAATPQCSLFSDSQLRYTEGVGLEANITCSSGATIGHIANIFRDIPQRHFKHIIVLCGANNINEDKDDDVFAKQTTVEIQRLIACLRTMSFSSVAIVPGLRNTTNPIELRQMALLEQTLKNETIEERDISVHVVASDILEFDEGNTNAVHLSRKGTVDLLDNFSQLPGFEQLVYDKAHSVTFPGKNIYTGVTSVYRYGCRFCDAVYFVKDGFCEACSREERFDQVASKDLSWT